MRRHFDFVAYADGSCDPNPGPACFGICIEASDGRTVHRRSETIGHATNNIAEWRGALAALDWFLTHGHGSVDLRMDSRLVVNQLTGRWRVKDAGLQPLAALGRERLSALAARGIACRVQWVPRESNRADAISRPRGSP